MAVNPVYRCGLVLIGLCAAAYLLLVSILLLDRPIADLILNIGPPSNVVIALLGILGEPAPYVIVGGLVLLFCGLVFVNTGFWFADIFIPNRAAFILTTAVTAWISAEGLQILFGRSRPLLYLEKSVYAFHPLIRDGDFASFPSGCAAVSAAAAAAFSIFVPKYRPTLSLIAVLVAFSRLLSASNYLSDIVAGMLLGLFIATFLEAIFARLAVPLGPSLAVTREQLRTKPTTERSGSNFIFLRSLATARRHALARFRSGCRWLG